MHFRKEKCGRDTETIKELKEDPINDIENIQVREDRWIKCF